MHRLPADGGLTPTPPPPAVHAPGAGVPAPSDATSAASPDASPARVARLALLAALAWHSLAWMADPARGPRPATSLLHGVSLAMHETGHLVFAPFGEPLVILGGSLLQILLPAAFVADFARRRLRFAAAVALWWVAQNGWDVAIYVADARAGALALVGGGEHDWAALLARWGRLEADVAIARALSRASAVLAILALAAGALAALAPAAAPADTPPDAR